MSEGHRHRHVRMRRDSLTLLTLRAATLAGTRDRQRAERSRFVWQPLGGGAWRLSLLGFLHGLVGLTTIIHDDEDDGADEEKGGR